MGKRGEDDDQPLARYLKYSYLGLQFMLMIALPVGLGIWLDGRFGTVVLFTVVGFALGFTGGIYSIYGELYGRRDRKPPDGRPPPGGSGKG